jgi:serine/threonine protein kinase
MTTPRLQSSAFATQVPDGLPAKGEVFEGKYQVEGVLGVGGMGVVLAANHLYLNERVAIKILLPEFAQNVGFAERFLREGRAAVKIRSEHVARVLDVGIRQDGSPYLVMEYLDGHTVGWTILRQGPFEVRVAVDLVLQACEALAEAHALGIVHRDVKPSNLFLISRVDGTRCVKVIDFGISKALHADSIESSLTLPNTIMGSPKYMAPEQMRSSRQIDARADIWALGATLHQMVCGSAPFRAETITEIWAAVLQDAPVALRQVQPAAPPALEAIILRCLEKAPELRFPNVADLAFALAPLGTPAAQVSAERIARVVRPSPVSHASTLPLSPSVGSISDISVSSPGQAVIPAPPHGFGQREVTGPAVGLAWTSFRRVLLVLGVFVLMAAVVGVILGVLRARHVTADDSPASASASPSVLQIPAQGDVPPLTPPATAVAIPTGAPPPTVPVGSLPAVREPAAEPSPTSRGGPSRPLRPWTRTTPANTAPAATATSTTGPTSPATPAGLASSRHE